MEYRAVKMHVSEFEETVAVYVDDRWKVEHLAVSDHVAFLILVRWTPIL